jgi:hypothetical protein
MRKHVLLSAVAGSVVLAAFAIGYQMGGSYVRLPRGDSPVQAGRSAKPPMQSAAPPEGIALPASGSDPGESLDPGEAELARLAFAHFADAVEWIRKNVPRAQQYETIRRLGCKVCEADLNKTEEVAAACSEASLKQAIREDAIATWGPKDPKSLAAYAASNFVGYLKGEAMYHAVNNLRYPRNDLASAAAIIDAMPHGSSRTTCIGLVAEKLAEAGTSKALDWVSSLPLKEDRDKALGAIASRLYESKNAEGLIDLANRAGTDEPRKQSLVAGAARITAEKYGADAAKDWVNSLPEEEKDLAIQGLVEGLAGTDPASATTFAQSLTGKPRQAAFNRILDSLTRQDPAIAAQWVTGTMSGEDQIAMAKSLATQWYNTDSIALSTWTNGLPTGPMKDAALVQMANSVYSSDRQAAIQTVRAIGDAAAKQDAARRLKISPEELAGTE